jgi:hypothetical protein
VDEISRVLRKVGIFLPEYTLYQIPEDSVIYKYNYDKLESEVITVCGNADKAEWHSVCIVSTGQNARWFPDLE